MLIVSIVISVVLVLAGTGTAGYFHRSQAAGYKAAPVWTAWREKPCSAPSWLHLEPIMPGATRTPVLGEGLHCALGGGDIEEERKPCSAPVSGACDDCESLAGPACKI